MGADGRPVPGSIASLEHIRLGSVDQGIMICAHDLDKPILLDLSVGPGQSDLPYTRVVMDAMSRDFVVVGWDQRRTGKSYAAIDLVSSLTLGQAVSDTIVMANDEKLYKPYQVPGPVSKKLSDAGLGPYGVFGSEYTLVERVNVLRGLIDMFTILYPQLQQIDFRRDVPVLAVPTCSIA
jgi:hypothetical protein